MTAHLQIVDLPKPALRLISADGSAIDLHPLWLRERCRSESSVDQRTGQRFYNPSDLDPDLAVTALRQAAPGVFVVTFSDGAVSHFREAELIAEAGLKPGADGLPELTAWDATLNPLPEAVWQSRPDDTLKLDIAAKFLRYGFVILHKVPAVDQGLFEVAETFGFVRDTNFGRHFNVRSIPNANDLAYSSLSLDPHTDNPYREPAPGIQLLHCLTNQTSGGLSTLVDGFACVEALRAQDPAAYDLLTKVQSRFRFQDVDADHVAWAPHVKLDENGVFQAVHFSPRLDFSPLLPAEQLQAFYAARRQLDRLLKAADFEIRFRLDDGDLVMFDNRRLLHGRTSFDTQEGIRHLQGCYIDSDGPRSLYRVLTRDDSGRVLAAE
ncbi:TauD/TfdA family dioxygenase [Dongia rigui]|uniref:TauD/TfdA family dioxygenase n=1 Tax=Dongia rigui TaxID=940149 RepID=A0ABU5E0B2_9PROT|nr:TauD/TfdA family dioxygenase [Dongia rigui]MDY0872328.1 TauD/TfdA family dioxygenase [Dongia rigui]